MADWLSASIHATTTAMEKSVCPECGAVDIAMDWNDTLLISKNIGPISSTVLLIRSRAGMDDGGR